MTDPKPTGRPQSPDSVPSRLAALAVGESLSVAVRFDGANPPTWSELTEERDRMANTLRGQIRQAKKRLPGATWEIELGDFRTTQGHPVAVVLATRSS